MVTRSRSDRIAIYLVRYIVADINTTVNKTWFFFILLFRHRHMTSIHIFNSASNTISH